MSGSKSSRRHFHYCAVLLLGFIICFKDLRAFTTITTSRGTYSLSDNTMSYSDAQTTCGGQGLAVRAFGSNVEFQKLKEHLDANLATYNGMEMWVSLTEDNSQVTLTYRFDNQEVDGNHWFAFEPSGGCYPNCCYRVRNFYVENVVNQPFGLADASDCSASYHALCGEGEVVTTTDTITTTDIPTTTTYDPTTTTDIPTTTTDIPTTTTYDPTTSTDITTTTTDIPTTTTYDTTTTTDIPTTTTDIPTTTTDVTLTTTTDVPTITVPVIPRTTLPPLAFSTGQQVSIVYIGLIIGTSLGISCACSMAWLAINRYRRHLSDETAVEDITKNNEDEIRDTSNSDSD